MSSGGGDIGSEDGEEDNIQVFVRIRPPCLDEPGYMRVVDVDPSNTQAILRQEPNPRTFSFDHVADIDSKQEEIFTKLGKNVIDNCIAGYNGTLFAYGQTGSGKTFTMMGPSEDSDNFQHELRGVIPRSFEYLFNRIARERELIYKEQIFDLLEPTTASLQLRESFKTGVYVAGLSEKVVADASEAYEVLSSSWVNRKVASTAMNRESSRSHAVFTLQIEIKERKSTGVGNIKTSCLNLVDLAGSERQKDTGATGIRLKEAGSINKSLSNLGNVIMALVSVSRDKKGRFVPYRDSKLTFLLRDSLGGNAKTRVIACVHPGSKCFAETLSTLQFAKRAKMIKNKARLNENAFGDSKQMQALIRSLQAEIKAMKQDKSLCIAGVPAQPSTYLADSMPILKEMFLQAMFLRQKSESEKQELLEVLEKLKDICDKKDKAIQTKKMIIKFRDNAIKRLEDKLKGTDVPQDLINEDLVNERDLLQVQVEQHPQVAKYALDLQRLKTTMKSLKEDSGILATVHKDSEKVRLLEEEYRKIIAEQQDVNEENQNTPQRADTVSTATVEKLRSQVADMESLIEQLKSELAENKQKSEKNDLYKDGEITSYKKTVAELEKVIEANNIRSKLEKNALNEQHLHTVMTITTPKKECYKLRNRTVVGKSDTPDLNDTIPFEGEKSPAADAQVVLEDEGILQEDLPDEVAQQAQEALLDQIKQMQEQNSRLESRLSEYEADRVLQLHNQSVVELQRNSIEELLEKEKQVTQTLREELDKVEPRLKEAIEEKDYALGARKDLDLILAQIDVELKEYKDKVKALEQSQRDSRTVEEMDIKLAERSLDIEKKDKEIEKLFEEKERLTSDLDTEMSTSNFFECQAKKFETKLFEMDEKVKTLEQNLQKAQKTILDETEYRESLVEQLSCESSEKDTELLKIIEESKALKEEYVAMETKLETNVELIATFTKDIKEKETKITNLEKLLKGTEEKVGEYCKRLEAESQSVQDLNEKLVALQEENEYYSKKEETLVNQKSELEKKVAEKEEELVNDRNRLNFEIDNLNEDLKAAQENIEEIQKEYTSSQEQLLISEQQCQKLTQEIEHLNMTLKEREDAMKERDAMKDDNSVELAKLTETLNDLERSRAESRKENSQLKSQLEEIQEKYQDTFMECESVRSEKQIATEKLEALHKRCTTAEEKASNCERELHLAQNGFRDIESRLTESETSLSEMKKENEQLRESETRLMGTAERDESTIKSQQKQLDEMTAKMKEVCQLFGESEAEGLVFDIEDLLPRMKALREENRNLYRQNNELIGHNNLKQKIKFHEKVKEENINLKKELISYKEKYTHVQDELKQLKRANAHFPDKSTNALKENRAPAQGKMFLSGGYHHTKSGN